MGEIRKKVGALLCCVAMLMPAAGTAAGARKCPPTKPDEVGPFYRPDAPVRSKIGTGYVLTGTVRSSVDCTPVPKARIEVWQAGPDGEYDDAHRATLIAATNGNYRLETHFPPRYVMRPPPPPLSCSGPRLPAPHHPALPEQGGKRGDLRPCARPGKIEIFCTDPESC